MKHPLTSKERRGLLAVAAAALLCIAFGFFFRNCSSHDAATSGPFVIENDSVVSEAGYRDSVSDKRNRKNKSETSNGKRSRRAKRQNAEKVYPSRSPLDEPCD